PSSSQPETAAAFYAYAFYVFTFTKLFVSLVNVSKNQKTTIMKRTHFILTMINSLQNSAGKENEEEQGNFVMKTLFSRAVSAVKNYKEAVTFSLLLGAFSFAQSVQGQNLQ